MTNWENDGQHLSARSPTCGGGQYASLHQGQVRHRRHVPADRSSTRRLGRRSTGSRSPISRTSRARNIDAHGVVTERLAETAARGSGCSREAGVCTPTPTQPARAHRVRACGTGDRAWRASSQSPRRALRPTGSRIVDELGTVTFAELDPRTDALAAGSTTSGVDPGDIGRRAVPQPPLLLRRNRRARQARRRRAVPEHRLLGAAAPRGDATRGRRRARPRRRVHAIVARRRRHSRSSR